MPKYLDGFLLPVPRKNLAAYRKMAVLAAKVWREHGALDYREGGLEDGDAKGMTPFAAATGARKGETVVFAWILYKSRAHRDRVNKKVMADPRLFPDDMDPKAMPFDCRRMAYGGFATLVGD